ncbi:hypothetical protein HPB51_005058 [Rhipicephalus microplus]|uniref:Uncharacterized protein n=1 Tax=Rhipicephalus microplus TaxID=6941 RepID=A0A9J6EXU8_RHIMP|nr:hypothetical protein HPB51_005058 [Rhipicephalus microplus]
MKMKSLSMMKVKALGGEEDDPVGSKTLDVNSTLNLCLSESIIAPFLTPERLVMEHAMLVAYLHCNVGTEVGCLLQELNISLEDLLKAHERGKWWVVGSAWAGNELSSDRKASMPSVQPEFSSKILKLAQKHHMNTDVRRNIFCIMMTAEDYLSASERIMHLNLTPTQEREMCHTIQFVDMSPALLKFLRTLFSSLLLNRPQGVYEKVFLKVADAPKLRLLREGLCLFLRHFYLRDRDMDSTVRSKLKQHAEHAEEILSSTDKKAIL